MTVDDCHHLGPGTEDPRAQTPGFSLVLASAGVGPIVAGAVASVLLPERAGMVTARLTCRWAGALLCCLAGVRRALSFREANGPTPGQLGSALWLYAAGFGALLSPGRVPPLLLLLLGFGSEAILDPLAARRHEAPRYFARLRPPQLALPILSLAWLLVRSRQR